MSQDTANRPREENRFAKRKPTCLKASITHAGGQDPIDVTVRDTSSCGARLQLADTNGVYPTSASHLPQNFTLNIPFERSQVDCETAWRNGPVMGVKYVSPTRVEPKSQPKREEEPPKQSFLKMLRNLEPL